MRNRASGEFGRGALILSVAAILAVLPGMPRAQVVSGGIPGIGAMAMPVVGSGFGQLEARTVFGAGISDQLRLPTSSLLFPQAAPQQNPDAALPAGLRVPQPAFQQTSDAGRILIASGRAPDPNDDGKPRSLAASLGGVSSPQGSAAKGIPAFVSNEKVPFQDEIEAFEAADRVQPPPQGAILFFGSSSIRFWTSLARDFHGLAVINRGFGGSQIQDCVRFAGRIAIPYHPKTIVFYAGDNDIFFGRSPEQALADFQALVKTLRSSLPDARILFVSIKPCPARWALVDKVKRANDLIRDYAAGEKGVGYIDVFPAMLNAQGGPRPELFGPDGLHMSPKGYALWTALIDPWLR
ncbi:MAG: SGNH/GDSL hydrolase family protein [Elusimicrobiota bacterium]|jgi:lysophospholipase L1-like esterase